MKNVQKKTTQKAVKGKVKKVAKNTVKKVVKKANAKKDVEVVKAPTVKVEAPVDALAMLKAAVEEAKHNMDAAKVEASELQQRARALISEAKASYRAALLPYREACKQAGVECEYSVGRLSNVSDRVVFLTEKVDGGIKVAIKGRPETERVISSEMLNKSLNRAAYTYAEDVIGQREKIGNKGGTLSNRLRKLWR